MSPVEGKVFERLAKFEQLSSEVKSQVQDVVTKILTPELFSSQSITMMSSAVGVKTPTLLEKISANSSKEEAPKILDALVYRGDLHPLNDTRVENLSEATKAIFAPTDRALAGKKDEVSVWSVAKSGAIQAGWMKSASKGIFGFATKDVYAVANDEQKVFALFSSDTALECLNKLEVGSDASVEFDDSIEHGIKVTNPSATVVVGATSKDKQDEWLNSIINAGAKYREAFNTDVKKVKDFYELKDYDMDGNEVSMSKYKGKVIMVVNVSSKCGLTPTNYPEMVELDNKYRKEGLQILAFPCNQFANQEPGTHEEIMEFVKQYNCEFPFFEKHDVNGENARPVFTYLKAKLPGSFGDFVKWNFTKFLIDRNGQPYKRFAPKEKPLSFEDEIKELLAQKPSNE